MSGKAFEELNLIDNFLFGVALGHEVHGPLIAKTILETILQREVKIRNINPEKTLFPPKPDLHGVRLDAYIEEGAIDVCPGDIFNLEPEKEGRKKKHLPKRSRFYHSRIDGHNLKSGQPYTALPTTWVIFITSFDPFGKNRMVYTIRNHCVELPEMNYDDGAVTLFLYVHGKKGNAPKKLREMLNYFSNTSRENACNSDLVSLQSCIDDIKTDPRIKEAYMDFDEFIQYEREEAAEEAIAERNAAIADRDAAIAERDSAVAEKNTAIAERETAIAEKNTAVANLDTALLKIKELEAKLLHLQAAFDNMGQKK